MIQNPIMPSLPCFLGCGLFNHKDQHCTVLGHFCALLVFDHDAIPGSNHSPKWHRLTVIGGPRMAETHGGLLGWNVLETWRP